VAGRIRDEDIATVRERSAIDEVVGEYLQLRNAGGDSLKGLCPFHEEKTPSFNVTPARGLWYCFSCAEGGDVIKFVQKIDALSFVEAVERLARCRAVSTASAAGCSMRTRPRPIFTSNEWAPRMPRRPGRSWLSADSNCPTSSSSGSGTRPPSGRR
jgi:hypothetical protein